MQPRTEHRASRPWIYASLAAPSDMIQVFSGGAEPSPLETWSAGSNPGGICLSPDGSILYTVLTGDEEVISIDTADGTVIGSVTVGSIPTGLAILPDGRYLYTANGLGRSGTIITRLGTRRPENRARNHSAPATAGSFQTLCSRWSMAEACPVRLGSAPGRRCGRRSRRRA